ncbi:MAG: Crp/Fnr family transcriptional regulator, partial [Myxococcota bacterium]
QAHPFPGASQAALQRVLARGVYAAYEDGTVLCEEGSLGEELFFLVSGNISVQRKDAAGTNRILTHSTQPRIFGHMAVIDGSKRSATCTAQGPVELVTLSRTELDRLLSETSIPGTALRRLLIASLCDQLSNANDFVRSLVEDLLIDDSSSSRTGTADNPGTKQSPPPSISQNMQTLSVKLEGWDSDLAELEELEKEIEFVVDEDTRRTVEARKK